jgi:hypothetical protein
MSSKGLHEKGLTIQGPCQVVGARNTLLGNLRRINTIKGMIFGLWVVSPIPERDLLGVADERDIGIGRVSFQDLPDNLTEAELLNRREMARSGGFELNFENRLRYGVVVIDAYE